MSIDLSTFSPKHSTQQKAPSQGKDFTFAKKLSEKKKEMFYKELAMLLHSGVDFKKALEILSNQSRNKLEKNIITGIKNKVVQGKGICDAMKESGHFSPYEYYSVRIGEETRKLEIVLEELQKFFNRKIQMRRQMVSVLTYPAIVMLVTLLVLYFMLNKVVPMFSSVFHQFGNELPPITLYIIKLSQHSGTLFTAFFIATAGAIIIYKINKNRIWYKRLSSRLLLKIPFFGDLVRKIYLSRFCQAMGLLTSSKTTLISSLRLTAKMIDFYPLEYSLNVIEHDITKGASLSESLRKHKIYEQRMVSMIDVAEQVNQLDVMFNRLTEQYNEEINHRTKMIGVILEPVIIIIIGLVVGVIMVAMYAPMFDLSKIIK